jgi:hypothetical protein
MRDAAGMREQFARLRKLAPDNSDLRLDEADFAFKDKRPRDGRALIVALLADPKTGADQIAATLGIWREYAAEGPDDASLAPIAATGSTAARLATAELLARQERTAAARRLLAGLDAATRMAHDALFAAREGRPDEALRLADKVLARDETHCLALCARTACCNRASPTRPCVRRSLPPANVPRRSRPGCSPPRPMRAAPIWKTPAASGGRG